MKNAKIFICRSGWVFVGNIEGYYPDENWYNLTKASVIRRWGTTKGIGELVNGPLKGTVLDPIGDITINSAHVIGIIQCNVKEFK